MTSICNTGFLNCTEVVGQIVISTTDYTTGSLFLTFLFVMLFLVAISMAFQIKLEYTSIVILPLLLGYMAYYSEFIGIGSVILIYFSILITKNFIIK